MIGSFDPFVFFLSLDMGSGQSVKNKADFYKKFPSAPASYYDDEKAVFAKYGKRTEDGKLGLRLEDWDKALENKSRDALLHVAFVASDRDRNGFVDWREYITALGYVMFGTPEQRFRVAFSLHDLDGNGKLDKSELIKCIAFVLELKETAASSHRTEAERMKKAKDRAERFIEIADIDGNGTVEIDEMWVALKRHPELGEDMLFFTLVGAGKQ